MSEVRALPGELEGGCFFCSVRPYFLEVWSPFVVGRLVSTPLHRGAPNCSLRRPFAPCRTPRPLPGPLDRCARRPLRPSRQYAQQPTARGPHRQATGLKPYYPYPETKNSLGMRNVPFASGRKSPETRRTRGLRATRLVSFWSAGICSSVPIDKSS